MTATEIQACNGGFDCKAPEHDEDTDCYSVTCVPPKCEAHGTPIVTCRECAATPPEGWQLVECTQDHPVMWMPDDGWGCEPPCMYCVAESYRDAHDGCEHARHGRWRRWRVTHWLEGRAYVLGLLAGAGRRWGGGCQGCLIGPRWRGRRPYILGLSRDSWRCLLRGRHLPGEHVGFGLCGKCCPCPECGSRTAGHEPGCAVGGEPA